MCDDETQPEKHLASLINQGITTYTGGRVTKQLIAESICREDVVHFACHGEFDPGEPLNSALIGASPARRLDRLTVSGIMGLARRSNLVTLSACNTGLARIPGGDGFAKVNSLETF
ncbi:MAG: CHAT domain-containing protein [Desulfobacterales bacterium]|nr:CHAT domain-containing protein [Desulfobacterales bacterium]